MDKSSIGPAPPNAVAEEQFRKGFEFAKSGDLDEAILNVEAALAVSPEESRYHDLLGTLYAKKGLYEMAVAEWKRSIESDPAHAEVFRRIETAEKMRVQPDPRASQWNLLAIGLLGVGLVLALVYATYQVRSTREQAARLASLEEQTENIERDYVPKTEFDSANDQIGSLKKAGAVKNASIARLAKKVRDFETSGNYIPKSELDKEIEISNRIRSELRAERTELHRLEMELAAIENASDVETMTAQIDRRRKENEALKASYESMNEDRRRLEREQAQTNLELTKSRGEVKSLKEQAASLLSATEGERLEAEIESLRKAVASAEQAPGTQGSAGPGVSFLLNQTLDAVEFALDGNKEKAIAALKEVEAKAPAGTHIERTLKKLAPTEQVRETPKKPKPTATLKPNPQPKPTATPKPKPKPKPTQAIVKSSPPPPASGDSPIAIPRRLSDGKPVAGPKVSSPPERVERLRKLQADKKRFADQALGLYKQRRFGQARAAVERGLRIDPRDPRLNQIRDAIAKAQGS